MITVAQIAHLIICLHWQPGSTGNILTLAGFLHWKDTHIGQTKKKYTIRLKKHVMYNSIVYFDYLFFSSSSSQMVKVGFCLRLDAFSRAIYIDIFNHLDRSYITVYWINLIVIPH